MNHQIIKLTPQNTHHAQQLIAFFQRDDGVQNPTVPADAYISGLLSSNSFHVFAALKDDAVIGGLTAYELPMFKDDVKEMFLYEIAVEEDFRQQHIATALIDALKKYCAGNGISIIFVGTSQDNEPAQKLYKATGGAVELIPWFTYDLSISDK